MISKKPKKNETTMHTVWSGGATEFQYTNEKRAEEVCKWSDYRFNCKYSENNLYALLADYQNQQRYENYHHVILVKIGRRLHVAEFNFNKD